MLAVPLRRSWDCHRESAATNNNTVGHLFGFTQVVGGTGRDCVSWNVKETRPELESYDLLAYYHVLCAHRSLNSEKQRYSLWMKDDDGRGRSRAVDAFRRQGRNWKVYCYSRLHCGKPRRPHVSQGTLCNCSTLVTLMF